ncbi:MAG: exonuclease, partial [Dehalococcoidia bacterium]|nr:exonuclease [Dehalococcoidia bacterium]
MLSSTFIHLPGVGETIEEEIWRSGITSWSEFISSPGLPARVEVRRGELCELLHECQERLASGDAAYFDRMLPPSEKWRLYPDFRDRAAFLDIE